MFVLPGDDDRLGWIAHRLVHYREKSRFRFDVAYDDVRVKGRHRRCLRLRRIRLLQAKDYCGQHAGPCPLRGVPHKNPRATYLEGGDWVAFDDMINDVLDRHRIEADVWSVGREFVKPYYIRRGRMRRTAYPGVWMRGRTAAERYTHPRFVATAPHAALAFLTWNCDEAVAGWSDAGFGQRRDQPRSAYEEGTPGIPEWRRSKSRRLERLLAASHHEDH